jgi:hypothetical protein
MACCCRWIIAFLVVIEAAHGASASPKKQKPTASATPNQCFSLTVGANSRGTKAVFKRRHLQSGGPTWSAILETAVKSYTTFIREGDGTAADMPGFGVPMVVTYRNAQTWYVIDDEGDAAIFCSGDKALLNAARADYERLNKDAKALERMLDRFDPRVLE